MRALAIVTAIIFAAGLAGPVFADTAKVSFDRTHPSRFTTLWHAGSRRVEAGPCGEGYDAPGACLALWAVDGSKRTALGGGYIVVKRLWARAKVYAGPDVLVMGDYGGSGGNADLLAVSFGPKVSVRKLSGDRISDANVDSSTGAMRYNLPFVIAGFNGAPHAGDVDVSLPLRWSKGDFMLDLKTLTGRVFTPEDVRFRELAVRQELGRWYEDSYPAQGLFPPVANGGTSVTVQALTDMMLSGHADAAYTLLQKTWPQRDGKPVLGEEAFWKALCHALVRNGRWKQFDLSRLPKAKVIEKAAE